MTALKREGSQRHPFARQKIQHRARPQARKI